MIIKLDFNKGDFYNRKYELECCTLLYGNKSMHKGINTTVFFEKDVKYKIKYNCDSSDGYKFTSFSWIYAYVMQYSDFNFYQESSNHKNQYFLLIIKNYSKFYIYIEN